MPRGKTVNATIGGGGVLIAPRALKSLNSREKTQPKMMVATFNGNPSAMLVKNLTSSTSLMSYPPLFVACWSITFSSSKT